MMLWYQGTWYSSKGSKSTKRQRSTRKNLGSFTIRSQFNQDRQKQKGHNNSYQHRRRQSMQIQIRIRKNQGRTWSTLRFYCKNLRRTKSKGQQAGRQADRQASRHKGCRQDRTRAFSPLRSSKTKTSKPDEFVRQW